MNGHIDLKLRNINTNNADWSWQLSTLKLIKDKDARGPFEGGSKILRGLGLKVPWRAKERGWSNFWSNECQNRT